MYQKQSCLPFCNLYQALLVFMTGIFFTGCASQNVSQVEITGQGLVDKLKSGWQPTILDVRSSMEYESGHVPGARNLSFWTPIFSSSEIPAEPGIPVVIYCEHGPRAYIAAYGLRKAGFQEVFYLTGHMSQWRKDGLPVEKPISE